MVKVRTGFVIDTSTLSDEAHKDLLVSLYERPDIRVHSSAHSEIICTSAAYDLETYGMGRANTRQLIEDILNVLQTKHSETKASNS